MVEGEPEIRRGDNECHFEERKQKKNARALKLFRTIGDLGGKKVCDTSFAVKQRTRALSQGRKERESNSLKEPCKKKSDCPRGTIEKRKLRGIGL